MRWYYIIKGTFFKEFRSKLKHCETIIDFEKDNKMDIEKVIEKYNNYIYTILKQSISKEEDIEELLSDVFTIFWRNYDKLDKNINVKAYLIGITRNLIKKKYRENYNIKLDIKNIDDYENSISSYINIEDIIETREKSKIISREIDNMKEEEKQIFIMFYYKEYKIKEISEMLNISITKVKVNLHRLRKSVKKKIKEKGDSYGK